MTMTMTMTMSQKVGATQNSIKLSGINVYLETSQQKKILTEPAGGHRPVVPTRNLVLDQT